MIFAYKAFLDIMLRALALKAKADKGKLKQGMHLLRRT